jgi:hypothetical protein
VGSALAQVEPEQNGFTSENKAARAAVREVAAWLRQRDTRVRASIEIAGDLEDEADR